MNHFPTLDETRQSLEDARSAFWFSVGAYALLTESPTREELRGFQIRVTNELLTVHKTGEPRNHAASPGAAYEIKILQSDPKVARPVVESTFRQMLMRGLGDVEQFARGSGRGDSIKKEPWYAFAGHVRNAIAHNGRWNFKSPAGLPIHWRHKSVEYSFNGHVFDGFLGWYDGLQLHAVMLHWLDCQRPEERATPQA